MTTDLTAAQERLARNLGLGDGRYALYPPPSAFGGFDDADLTTAIRISNGDPIPAQLALHFDIPASYRSSFRRADAPLLEQDRVRAEAYRDRLVREVGLVGRLFDRDRDVVGVSLAPGMTRWMSPQQVAELLESLGRHFHVRRSGIDLSMTLDLDTPSAAPLEEWARLGFNRVSISLAAIMDADAPTLEVARLVERARNAGFANLRIELPYGPSTPPTLAALLVAAIKAAPERVGLRYCPPADEAQVGTDPAVIQQGRARTLLAAADALEAAGYLHVGVDLFARPNDPLILARQRKQLYRDALGFGAHGATHLVGFGVGAISQLGGCHAQNPLQLAAWEARIDRGNRAVERGVALNDDDQLRAEVLQHILCYGRIETDQLEHHHHVDFRAYFAAELQRLQPLLADGSLHWDGDALVLDHTARLSSRAVASQFDPMHAAAHAMAGLVPAAGRLQ